MAERTAAMTAPGREQRLVFGEIARQYDAARPSYPDALFDAIMDYGELRAGDRALEIGAGTGKATTGFLARGLAVHALEPSPPMAEVLRTKGVDAQEILFEAWDPPDDDFRLVYAAQSWHWVQSADRYERAAAALSRGGTLALFWNKGREWTGALGAENDAAYERYAPEMGRSTGWDLDWVVEGIAACPALDPASHRRVSWSCAYTRAQWIELLATHSDHRILPEEQRARLHDAVGAAIDRHGGRVEVVYDVELFLSRRV